MNAGNVDNNPAVEELREKLAMEDPEFVRLFWATALFAIAFPKDRIKESLNGKNNLETT